jgi:hypothetical protein
MRTRRRATALTALALGAALVAADPMATAAPTPTGAWGQALVATPEAQASAAIDAAAAPGESKIIVRSVPADVSFVDVGAQGSYNVFTERVLNQAGTRRLGFSTVQCTFFFTRSKCAATYSFAGRGNIEFAGMLSTPKGPGGDVFAVTGGTGEFENMTGEVHAVFQDDGSVVFVIHLTS